MQWMGVFALILECRKILYFLSGNWSFGGDIPTIRLLYDLFFASHAWISYVPNGSNLRIRSYNASYQSVYERYNLSNFQVTMGVN